MTSIDDLLLLSDLHLTDLDANDKGKLRADAPLTDALLAQQFYRAELNTLKSCLLDAKLAASIDSALGTDAGVLAAIEEQNRLAERDAEIARRMQELLSSGRESQLRHLFAEYQCEELKIEPSRSAGPSNSGSTPSTTASGSKEFIKSTAASPAGRSSTTIKAPPHECVICTDSITSNPFKAPCGDTYCRKCIADLFLAATRDETLMPPRCCKKPIPLDLVTGMLTKAQIEAFEMKLLQYNTPDPMFCPNPSCASFIPPNAVKKPTTTCPSCSTNDGGT
ncbi:hypothetical protein HK097_009384 [Rhizophlyctis rosea]|uniref:RING-type domain-containing protein n=1 Tax=Rhizophlyctis rosea TaxID=64517 RepID=A0AAD5S911_9FUNG|nr:hypothetical protein HK097_009384 [Rhizophlyctis rosea]